jgi:hypothetical protein
MGYRNRSSAVLLPSYMAFVGSIFVVSCQLVVVETESCCCIEVRRSMIILHKADRERNNQDDEGRQRGVKKDGRGE